MVLLDRWHAPEGVDPAAVWYPPADLARLVPMSADLDLFVRMTPQLVTQQRRPLYVEPFQIVYLADHFAGSTVTTIIQPKKLGKSTIVAAVAIFHILTTHDADCIIVAAAKHQAKIIYRHVVGFVTRSAGKSLDLTERLIVREGSNEIRNAADLGRIRVLAADDQTLEGVEPTLGLIDEYGQHTDTKGYDPLNDGLDTRNGRLLIISNAGDDEEGPLGVKRMDMREHILYDADGYTYCRRPDRSEAMHEIGLNPETDDTEDIETVKSVNLASWMTRAALQRRKDSRSTIGRWQRMACGVWVRTDMGAIQAWEWDAIKSDERIPAGADAILGLDVAFSGGKGKFPTDTTAIVPHHWTATGRRLIGDPIILEPPPGDGRLDDRAIEWALEVVAGTRKWDRLAFEIELADENDGASVGRWADAIEAAGVYRVRAIVYDPNAGAEQLVNAFRRRHPGIKFVEFDQRGLSAARADGRFMEALRAKQLAHTGHRGLRRHVINAVERPVPGGDSDAFIFDHPKKPRKPQDALRAASMAHDAAVSNGGTGHHKGAGIYFA